MKLFQNLIYQIIDIINDEFGVLDEMGLILACSDEKKIGQYIPLAVKAAESKEQKTTLEGISFQKIYIRGKLEFLTYINSDSPDSLKHLSLISINIANLKVYYEEKFDKGNFIKSIIMDSIFSGDIAYRAKELHLANNVYRAVFLVKVVKSKGIHSYEVIQNLFPNKLKDFVVALDDESTVLVKEMKSGNDLRELENTGRIIIDTLNTEIMVKAVVGIGTIVESIRDIGRSFKEAQTALSIGSIFENGKTIINYNSLGLGRLVFQLPTTLCRLFLNEVFNENSFESLDTETLFTIQKFFENSLNISETSRQLYVHRNTLVYRLDKIQKMTGLDLRKFDDAIIFKVSMLVKKYLDKCEKTI